MLVRLARGATAATRGCGAHARRIVPTAVCGRPLRRTHSPCHMDTSPEKRCNASGGGFCRDGGRATACFAHTEASGAGSPGDIGRADCTRRCGGLLGRSACLQGTPSLSASAARAGCRVAVAHTLLQGLLVRLRRCSAACEALGGATSAGHLYGATARCSHSKSPLVVPSWLPRP